MVIAMSSDIFTIKEVAEYLKLNEKTAYRLAADGKIPGFKVGGSWRFRRDQIEKMTKGKGLDEKSDES
jgi:excisionase family DNA binding protein